MKYDFPYWIWYLLAIFSFLGSMQALYDLIYQIDKHTASLVCGVICGLICAIVFFLLGNKQLKK